MSEHLPRRTFLGGAATVAATVAVVGSLPERAAAAPAPRPVAPDIARLLAKMTLAEKIGQLNMPVPNAGGPSAGQGSPPNPVSGIATINKFVQGTYAGYLGPGGGFFALGSSTGTAGPRAQATLLNQLQSVAKGTRLGIPLLQIVEGTHGSTLPGSTIFPEGPALGSTWDTGLIQRIFATAALEARVVGVHALSTLVAEVNRDPRMGRNCEAYSEDPYLTAQIVGAIVRGAQTHDPATGDKVAALLTDFPTQNPSTSGMERGEVEVSARELEATHLPPWDAGIGQEGALIVMASYSAVDGSPAHGSRHLMTDVLRHRVGFDGVVVSEGLGFQTLITERTAVDQRDAGIQSLHAGVDVNITWESAFLNDLYAAARSDAAVAADVDTAVARVLTLKKRLGLFENTTVDPARAEAVVHAADHQQLALEAARESLVLLKNDKGLLPLHKSIRKLAVIGPNADSATALLGDYRPDPVLQAVPSILAAIKTKLGSHTSVAYARGCDIVSTDTKDVKAAVNAARHADAAIVVLGETPGAYVPGATVGEAQDVADLDLSGGQQALIEAVVATGTPTVVVLVNGRPLSIRWVAQHVPAIVEAWFPGEKGGQAIADVLFGDQNPCGRLPISVPRHVGQLPIWYNGKSGRASRIPTTPNPPAGYTDYVDIPATPLYEFGFGLSYTTFAYRDLRLQSTTIKAGRPLSLQVTVTNTGKVAGKEVVQVYLRDEVASVALPEHELKAFAKVSLAPGASQTITITLPPEAFQLVDATARRTIEPGRFEVQVGSSSARIALRDTVRVS